MHVLNDYEGYIKKIDLENMKDPFFEMELDDLDVKSVVEYLKSNK